MKRMLCLMLVSLLVPGLLSGCGAKQEGFDPAESIGLIAREEGSGTRGAFVELFGIEKKDENGEKVDYTLSSAAITNSTSVMMSTVSGDLYAIGYLSLGSLNDTVKAVKIDGAEASVENIQNGSYRISRPFNIATLSDLSAETEDFIRYILSKDAQAIIEENGYIPLSDVPAYTPSLGSGKIVIAGSSSVGPVMEKLKEAYQVLNPHVRIELQINDSSTGLSYAAEGLCDIAMASRALKDSEIEKGLKSTTIAMDGIAVIVNLENPVDALSMDDVEGIYTGRCSTWAEVME